MFKSANLAAACLVCASVFAPSLAAATLFSTEFNDPSADLAATLATYGLSSNGVIAANAGVLSIFVATAGSLDIGAFAGDLHVEVGITVSGAAPGNINAGLRIGDNTMVFHPGYAPIPGAFRISGPGGFGNTSMGFVPSLNAFNRMIVDIDGATGLMDIAIRDGNDPQLVFETTFQAPNYVPGVSPIGLMVGAIPGGGGFALFDQVLIADGVPNDQNLTIDNVTYYGASGGSISFGRTLGVANVPVPAVLPLFVLGLAGLLRRRRS